MNVFHLCVQLLLSVDLSRMFVLCPHNQFGLALYSNHRFERDNRDSISITVLCNNVWPFKQTRILNIFNASFFYERFGSKCLYK